MDEFSIDTGIICGGVAANTRLREKLSELDKKIIYPSMKYCTDNADMIAFLAEHKINNKKRGRGSAGHGARAPLNKSMKKEKTE